MARIFAKNVDSARIARGGSIREANQDKRRHENRPIVPIEHRVIDADLVAERGGHSAHSASDLGSQYLTDQVLPFGIGVDSIAGQ